jgi:hypothetical protein
LSSFPASQVAERLEIHDKTCGIYPLRGVGKELVSADVGREYIQALVEAGIVCGVGSRQRFNYFELTVDQEEAARLLGRGAGDLRRERGMTPLDLMRRYCADRKTTRKVYMTVQHGRRVFHASVFEHKPNAKLRLRGEA